MRLDVTTTGIQIIPENAQDIIYIEKYLGLTNDGDYVRLVRQNIHSMSALAYITTHPFPGEGKHEVKIK